MPRVRYPRSAPNPRAGGERQARCLTDLLECERIELRRDLALEPCLVALAWMLARPVAIALMRLSDRFAFARRCVVDRALPRSALRAYCELPRSLAVHARASLSACNASQCRRLRFNTGSPPSCPANRR